MVRIHSYPRLLQSHSSDAELFAGRCRPYGFALVWIEGMVHVSDVPFSLFSLKNVGGPDAWSRSGQIAVVAVTPMLCADLVIAGLKSSTKCGSIEPYITPSSITAISSSTAPGSFNSKNVNNRSLFPLKTDRKSFWPLKSNSPMERYRL